MNIRRFAWFLALAIITMSSLIACSAIAPKTFEGPRPIDGVIVELRSDGKPYVSIPNRVSPSKFRSKKIVLVPGDYTARGQRKGYQEEFVEFIVVPDMNPNAVTVICVSK